MSNMLSIALLLLALVASLTTAASTNSAGYRRIEEYSGPSFYDGFTWFNDTDPTNGFVQYVDIDTSAMNNLTAFVMREQAQAVNSYVGVDFSQKVVANVTPGLNSVRLLSKATFDVGLLAVIDVLHAPTGTGVWPAVWLLGNVSNTLWPDSGEIDIMEWVNNDNENHMTLHSASGCLVENDQTALGTLASNDCNQDEGHAGCSITAPPKITSNGQQLATAGAPFNAQGGGVYVLEWTEDGVTTWLFPRDGLPQDLTSENPDPSTWTAKPLAKFGGSGCDFTSMFQQQQLIINIDLCGDWAGNQTLWDANFASTTGAASCNAYVASHPENFKDAFFEFASIKMYSSNPSPPGRAADHPSNAKRDVQLNGIRDSEGISEAPARDATSGAREHIRRAQLHQPSISSYRFTTTAVSRGPAGASTPGMPSITAGVPPRPKSSANSVEASGYMLTAFVALLVAALI